MTLARVGAARTFPAPRCSAHHSPHTTHIPPPPATPSACLSIQVGARRKERAARGHSGVQTVWRTVAWRFREGVWAGAGRVIGRAGERSRRVRIRVACVEGIVPIVEGISAALRQVSNRNDVYAWLVPACGAGIATQLWGYRHCVGAVRCGGGDGCRPGRGLKFCRYS